MKIEMSNRNANYLILLVLKNTFNLLKLASAKEIRIQQLINQKPDHPYYRFITKQLMLLKSQEIYQFVT